MRRRLSFGLGQGFRRSFFRTCLGRMTSCQYRRTRYVVFHHISLMRVVPKFGLTYVRVFSTTYLNWTPYFHSKYGTFSTQDTHIENASRRCISRGRTQTVPSWSSATCWLRIRTMERCPMSIVRLPLRPLPFSVLIRPASRRLGDRPSANIRDCEWPNPWSSFARPSI